MKLLKDFIMVIFIAILIHFLIRFGGVLLELIRPKIVFFLFGQEIGNAILGI